MNVGQVLETHLGWAAKGLGHKIGQMLDAAQTALKITQVFKSIYNVS